MSKLLLLGASGAVGSQVLAAALSSPQILTVHALGRTPPPATHTKLLSGSIDFNALVLDDPEAVRKVRELDVEFVVIALGTTRANAGSMEKFVKIDKEYVIAAAKAARVEGKKQRLVYCSSTSASSASFFPYLKSKGLTEEALANLGYEETLIMRPGMLAVPGGRKEARWAEAAFGKVTGVLAHLTNSLEIGTPLLGKAMVQAALQGKEGLSKANLGKEELLAGKAAFVLGNKDLLALGKSVASDA